MSATWRLQQRSLQNGKTDALDMIVGLLLCVFLWPVITALLIRLEYDQDD